jgi:3-phenylpropionate/trans-cinnamate dioxygenase ferredoxin subunit
LPPGQVRRVEVEGRVLALVNRDGQFYALDAVCPHQGGPLDQGELWRGALECPWHHFCYDPATGANLYPGNVYPSDLPQLQSQLRPANVYTVRVRGDEILVAVPDGKEEP